MARSILVTGGAGFIGSHLVESLIRDGFRVCVLDNFDPFYSERIKRENVAGLDGVGVGEYTLCECDIRDRASLHQIFREFEPEMVVHLAAKAGVRPSLANPGQYCDVNVAGTVNLLDMSVQNHVEKFVFASSSSVYGHNEKVPFCETDPTFLPASPYGATKIAGEALCRSYSNCYGLPVVALRFFTVYGPRQRPDLAIHKFVRNVFLGESIPVFGDGTSSRDYTFIDDIVAGIRSAIELTLHGCEIFNLGNDHPTKLVDLIRLIEERVGLSAQIEWQPPQVGDVPRTWANINKARQVLGYTPHTPLDQGIAAFVQWLEKQPAVLAARR